MPKIAISTTPVKVVDIDNKRVKVFLQNVGTEPIYFTKQNYADIPNIPSKTNYDFVLHPVEEKVVANKDRECITQIEVYSTAIFNAISEGDGSELAYMETSKVVI